MKQKRNREQIIDLLRRIDRSLDRYSTIKEACEENGISRSSFYRWQRRLGLETSEKHRGTEQERKRISLLEDQVIALGHAAQGN